MATPESSGRTDLASLTLKQLSSVKKQLDDELEHLTSSFGKLRAAQAKFYECLKSIQDGVGQKIKEKSILVPLTTSLYVPGSLADSEKVIVDVGTGFYVEKTTEEALEFYSARINDLTGNLKEVEGIVQGKTNNLGVVEEVLRQKVTNNNSS